MESFYTHEKQQIFYKVHGSADAPPVMLLHGFGEDGSIWDAQVAALKDKYQVFVPDIPGSGKSSCDDKEHGPVSRISSMCSTFNSFASSIIHRPYHLVGHSMGGYIGMQMVKGNADILSFTLAHSSAYADKEDKKEKRAKSIEFIKENGSGPFFKTAIPGLFREDYVSSHPEIMDKLIANASTFPPEALVAYYTAMRERPDTSTHFNELKIPVFFIIGRHDQAVSPSDALRQVPLPQVSMVTILEDAAHMGMLESTDTFNADLLTFLQYADGIKDIF